MIKKFLVVCISLFVLASVSSCTSSTSSITNDIPSNANIVVQVEMNKILTNPALRILYSELAKMEFDWPQTVDEVLNELLQKSGFDLSTISTAVYFAKIDSTDQMENSYAGVIASGNFDESAIISKIQQQTNQTFSTSDYKGYTIYADAKGNIEIVFFSQSQLALGAPKAIRDVIDVNKGDRQPLSGSLIDLKKRLGNSLISAVAAIPEDLRGKFDNVPSTQTPVSLKSFADIQTIGFAIDQPVLNITVRIDAQFSTPASAQDAKDAVTGLISLAKGMTQDQTIENALNDIKVSIDSSRLSIREEVSLEDIPVIINSFQKLSDE